MPHYGTLRSFSTNTATQDADDIRGAKLYGRNDERLGEIDDVIFDHESGDIRYAVVDTGGWLSSKQFLVPADRIEIRSDKDRGDVDADDLDYRVNLSKEEIERFPAYDADAHHSEGRFDNERFRDYEDRYRDSAKDYFADSTVLHRADSANLLTAPGTPPKAGADSAGPTIDTRMHHQYSERTAGPMNTSPTAWGNHPDDRRLEFQPELRENRPDLETTSTNEIDDQIDSSPSGVRADRPMSDQQGGGFGNSQSGLGTSQPSVPSSATYEQTAIRSRDRRNEPFRDVEVGGVSRQANELERRNMQQESELYKGARRGEPLAGEFPDQRSSRSGTQVPGNQTNASDAEMRTAEGDSVFNNADPQATWIASPSGSTSSAPMQQGEARSFAQQSGRRWSRFQNRLREQRGSYTGDCAICSSGGHRTDQKLHDDMRADRGLRNTKDSSDKVA